MKIDITRIPLIPALLMCGALMCLVSVRHMLLPLDAELMAGGVMPLGIAIENLLGSGSLLSIIIFMCIVLINAILVTRIMIQNMITITRTYLPLLIYVVVACGIYCHRSGAVSALSATLLLLAMQYMIRGFRRQASIGLFFHASLLIGAIPLLWAPGILFGLIIPVAIRLFRRSASEMCVSIVGFALPVATACYVGWAGGDSFAQFAADLWSTLTTQSDYSFLSMDMGVIRLVVWSLLIVLTCLSVGTFVAHANNMRTRRRRVYSLHLYLLAISIGIMFVPSLTPIVLPLLAAPLAVVLQTFFVNHTGLVSSILYILLITAIVVLNLLAFF